MNTPSQAQPWNTDRTEVRARVIDPRSANGSGLPLCIEPSKPVAEAELIDWISAKKESLSAAILQHGAVLLRGFPIHSAQVFESVLLALGAELKNDYQGTSPRNAVTRYIFNASELPGYYPIPQHCEMSFLRDPPRRLFFCCLVEPQSVGGETPLCDFRLMLRDLDPQVRSRFASRGVKVIRNYGGPEGHGRRDLWQLKPWHDIFGTTDRALVEQKCQQVGQQFEWLPDGRLRLINQTAAIRNHPQTGEPVWFNHTQVFHLSSAQGEYRRISQRLPAYRYHLLRALAAVVSSYKRWRLADDEQAMQALYGDGTPIPDSDMEAVRDAIWRNMVVTRWRRGDALLIDNSAVSHGRLPYHGPRKVIVGWE
ncbi:MAG: TauD/TfdA family dioxygenase [Myxococcales bacterium]|nr:TauD/TfdA family dioxygenase [Myxococcales bacterium]